MTRSYCWQDRRAHIEAVHGMESDEWAAMWVDDWVNATCMLPKGHAGSHQWTADDEIEVTFPAAAKEEPYT